ncbi:MAG: PEGA domain-containing protein, partial [Polyangiaceae bacterium]
MRARTVVAALAVILGLLAGSTPVMAAPPATAAPSAADLASARKLFQTGLKLYNEGSYREALASFRKANDIAPRASLQRNIAQCHRDLKDFAAAYDAYRILLAKYGAKMGAAEKRAVERAIDELAMLTGGVRVTVTEPGATVSLDDHEVGTTPLAGPVRANLGPHVVTVTKAGLEPIRKELRLTGGDEVVVAGPMQPEVTTGHLVVNAPPGAKVEVFVDGADVGPAPWEGDVKPGVHTVESKGSDRFSPPRDVDVPRRERVELALELAASTGRVQIDTHT